MNLQASFEEIICCRPLALKICWSEEKIFLLELIWNPTQHCLHDFDSLTPVAQNLKHALEQYLQGIGINWPELPLAWSRVPAFSRTVLQSLRKEIGFGQWISYSKLAELAGKPGGARAVGQAMRKNPWPLVVPCHRVLTKDKQLGGFSSGLEVKKYLLQVENIKYIF